MTDRLNLELIRLFEKLHINRWSENDIKVFIACLKYDIDTLNKTEFHYRLIIDALKNLPEELDFLFTTLPDLCKDDPASYYFSKVLNVRTFDIYHKHGIKFWIDEDDLPQEQLEYLFFKGYITIEEYNRGKYGYEIGNKMNHYGLNYEEYLEMEKLELDNEKEKK